LGAENGVEDMDVKMTRRIALKVSAATLGAAGILGDRAFAYDLETPVDLVVTTAEGRLRGERTNRLKVFRGVSYAESTGGKNRFRRAVPVQPWEGVRDALTYGPPCFQKNPDWAAFKDDTDGSEDCLKLNIFSPTTSDATAKPVMVFFHGGGYAYGSGSAPAYRGLTLAEQGDVVLVTVTHRIHLLGFLYLAGVSDDFKEDTNLSILDLVEALRWINRNIAAFGGDPNNVTIFGESGGGGKVSAMLAVPEAKGLFSKAIVQSGSALTLSGPAAATEAAHQALVKLGVSVDNLQALQDVPVERFWDVHQEMTGGNPVAIFRPVVDPQSIPHDLSTPEALAMSAEVPMIIGSNHDEATMFLLNVLSAPPQTLDDARTSTLEGLGLQGTPEAAAIEDLVALYAKTYPDLSPADLAFRVGTEVMFGHDALLQSRTRARANSAPVYLYQFTWAEPMFGGNYASHAVELPYLFGGLEFDDLWGEPGLLVRREEAEPGRVSPRMESQAPQCFLIGRPLTRPNFPQWSSMTRAKS
jgi:para-nitrobenzyl esterase